MSEWESIAVRTTQGGLPVTEVLGLPLHPLLVHGSVVLVPLTALGLIVMFTNIKRGQRYAPAVLFVAAMATITSFLAAESGKDLADDLGLGRRDHFEFGEYVPWAAAAMFGVALLLAGLDKQAKGGRSGVAKLLALVGAVGSLVAVALVVYVGHTGAELVWGR